MYSLPSELPSPIPTPPLPSDLKEGGVTTAADVAVLTLFSYLLAHENGCVVFVVAGKSNARAN